MAKKKNELSTDSIIMFGLIAFIVSMFSTVAFLSPPGITGWLSQQTGYVNVTVTSEISITLPVSAVIFINQSTGSTNATDIAGGPSPFNVSNQGNTLINLTVESDVDGSSLFATGGATGDFQWNCTAGSALVGTCEYLNASAGVWGNVTTATWTMIDNFNFSTPSNWAELEINISVPANEPSGVKEAVITFTGQTT